MPANLLLLFCAISWIIMAALSLQQRQTKGEYLVGWGMLQFIFLGVFGLLSLFLTINLASGGGFDWVSGTRGTRNLVVGAGWVCLLAGVAFCVLGNPGRPAASMLEKTLSYGVVWMPLLMLVPYAILGNPGWKAGVSPMAYTLPLALGSLIGFALLVAPRILASSQHRKMAREMADADFKNTMKTIEKEKGLAQLLKYAENYDDERFRAAALAKVKAFPALEDSLIDLLQQKELTEAHWTYVYLAQNDVENPNRFLKPVKDNLAALALVYAQTLAQPDSGDYTIYYTNVATICKAIDAQLGAYRTEFKPAIQQLLNALDTPVPDEPKAPQGLIEQRDKYSVVLKEWLMK